MRRGCGPQGLARPRACVAAPRGVPGRERAGGPGCRQRGCWPPRTAGELRAGSGWVSPGPRGAGGEEHRAADLQGRQPLSSRLQHPCRVGSSPLSVASRILTGS